MKQLVNSIFIFSFIALFSLSARSDNNPSKENGNQTQTLSKSAFQNLLNDPDYKPLFEDSKKVRLAFMNIQVDVLGIVFFGPQVSMDFQVGNIISIGPYFRWHYAGVLYQGFMTEFWSDGTTLDLASYGIGGQMKFLIPVGSGRNRPYIGGGYEKFYGKESYDAGSGIGLKISEYKSNVLHFDIGYRHLTEGSFNFSVGLSLAVSKVCEAFNYFEDHPDDIYNTPIGETMVFPVIQMALGWQIGKH